MCLFYPAFNSCCGIQLRVGLVFVAISSIVTGAVLNCALKKAGVNVTDITDIKGLATISFKSIKLSAEDGKATTPITKDTTSGENLLKERHGQGPTWTTTMKYHTVKIVKDDGETEVIRFYDEEDEDRPIFKDDPDSDLEPVSFAETTLHITSHSTKTNTISPSPISTTSPTRPTSPTSTKSTITTKTTTPPTPGPSIINRPAANLTKNEVRKRVEKGLPIRNRRNTTRWSSGLVHVHDSDYESDSVSESHSVSRPNSVVTTPPAPQKNQSLSIRNRRDTSDTTWWSSGLVHVHDSDYESDSVSESHSVSRPNSVAMTPPARLKLEGLPIRNRRDTSDTTRWSSGLVHVHDSDYESDSVSESHSASRPNSVVMTPPARRKLESTTTHSTTDDPGRSGTTSSYPGRTLKATSYSGVTASTYPCRTVNTTDDALRTGTTDNIAFDSTTKSAENNVDKLAKMVSQGGLNVLSIAFIGLGVLLLIATFSDSPELALVYVVLCVGMCLLSACCFIAVGVHCVRVPGSCLLVKLDTPSKFILMIGWFVDIFVWAFFAAVANGFAQDTAFVEQPGPL